MQKLTSNAEMNSTKVFIGFVHFAHIVTFIPKNVILIDCHVLSESVLPFCSVYCVTKDT